MVNNDLTSFKRFSKISTIFVETTFGNGIIFSLFDLVDKNGCWWQRWEIQLPTYHCHQHRPWASKVLNSHFLIHEFLGQSASAISGKKIQKYSLWLYVHIECQFGLIMMLIKNGICQREGKYASLNKNICHFRGRYRTGFSLKIKNTDTFKNYEWLRSEFFSQWTVRRTLIVVTQTSLFLISVLCHFYIWQSQKV